MDNPALPEAAPAVAPLPTGAGETGPPVADPTSVSTPEAPAAGAAPATDESWTPAQQAAWTKKSQGLADERKTWEAEKAQQTQLVQQQTQQVQQYYQQLQAAAQQLQRQQQGPNPLANLEQMEVVDGRTAQALVQQIAQARQGDSDQLKRLAEQNQFLYQRMQEMGGQLQGVNGRNAEADYEATVTRGITAAGFDPQVPALREMAKDIYLSHQNDQDLQANIGGLIKSRLDGAREVALAAARAQAEQQAKAPFTAATGGEGLPTGIADDSGHLPIKELGGKLWDLINVGPEKE